MIELNQRIAELTQSGTTAALLLDTQKQFSAICIEETLRKIDTAIANDTMTMERAFAAVHEIAAYRRIVYRQAQAVDVGRSAARHAMEQS